MLIFLRLFGQRKERREEDGKSNVDWFRNGLEISYIYIGMSTHPNPPRVAVG